MEPGKFLVPQMCCKCLALADRNFEMSGEYGSYEPDTTIYKQTIYTIQVPICAACSRRAINMKIWGVALLLVLPIVGALLGRAIPAAGMWLGVGGVALGICAVAGLWNLSRPGKVTKAGLPLFENPQYQVQFEQLNKIDPKSYGFMDRLYTDVNKAVDDEKRSRKGP